VEVVGFDRVGAFSPGPTSNVYPLESGANNAEVYKQIKRDGVEIRSLADAKTVALSGFANGFLLFTTEFDTYSAAALGDLKKKTNRRRPQP
jgi:hypothetical protein